MLAWNYVGTFLAVTILASSALMGLWTPRSRPRLEVTPDMHQTICSSSMAAHLDLQPLTCVPCTATSSQSPSQSPSRFSFSATPTSAQSGGCSSVNDMVKSTLIKKLNMEMKIMGEEHEFKMGLMRAK